MKAIAWKPLLDKYKYVALVILIGVILLLLPSGTKSEGTTQQESRAETFDLEAFEQKLGGILSEIEGAGEVQVILTVRGSTKQVFAQDNKQSLRESSNEYTESTVVISRGSGSQEAILVEAVYPEFQGAVLVCPGGNDPAVKLRLMEAISALTGLGTDKISVCQSN